MASIPPLLMAAQNVFSLFGVHKGFIWPLVVCCTILSLTTATAAIPVEDATSQDISEEEQHREKRAVTKAPCVQPSDLEDMFNKVNSEMNRTQFLQKAINGQAISVPASEKAKLIDGDPNENKTCPTSVTRDNTAPLAHRSLCPYYFDILQLPEGYYPPTLRWARCKCQQCLEQNVFGCEAVKTNIAVLKPVGCFQGLQKYEEQIVEISTACACVYKGVVRSKVVSWGIE